MSTGQTKGRKGGRLGENRQKGRKGGVRGTYKEDKEEGF